MLSLKQLCLNVIFQQLAPDLHDETIKHILKINNNKDQIIKMISRNIPNNYIITNSITNKDKIDILFIELNDFYLENIYKYFYDTFVNVLKMNKWELLFYGKLNILIEDNEKYDLEFCSKIKSKVTCQNDVIGLILSSDFSFKKLEIVLMSMGSFFRISDFQNISRGNFWVNDHYYSFLNIKFNMYSQD